MIMCLFLGGLVFFIFFILFFLFCFFGCYRQESFDSSRFSENSCSLHFFPFFKPVIKWHDTSYFQVIIICGKEN